MLWTGPGIRENTGFELAFSVCQVSSSWIPFPLSCTVHWPSALTLSQPAALFLFRDLNFHSCLISLCFCWALEDNKAPLTPHCPGEIEGREQIFQISKLNSYETIWNTHHGEEHFWEWFMWNTNTPGSNLRSPTQPGLSTAPQLRWVTCVHLSFSLNSYMQKS